MTTPIRSRGDFTRAEIIDATETDHAAAEARDDVKSDFRRQEILELNADADNKGVEKWVLIGLGCILAYSLFMSPAQRRRK